MPRETKYKKFLRDKSLSQLDVAKQLHKKPPYISQIVNGYQNINLKMLKALVILHQVGPNELLDWEDWIAEDKKNKESKK